MRKGLKTILFASFLSLCTMKAVIWQKKENQRRRHAAVLRDISRRSEKMAETS
ncbi:hypothetical protein TOT_030000473 [Theileria orientalis strain Shintoku]|uniref:Uncharacterized protein n=1 Tax=Theileria orientalis strain Shintoku TaxID=869250 RepID=J4D962_THEOR|nr:hypothetical protein TOT_030000473 [Theileria orientalis strain Shintoku]PVC52761.1 hypothetical protein MACL_00000506 [Theileria orientalis]BAM41210.1 hypothetical protein TOT_030000473 [Theileria orientalis strain Shintoku]|eukprot:XP_009691511.1 hypothetical protein TOT_030000473 [Theileria orientalis strain Shintoku]